MGGAEEAFRRTGRWIVVLLILFFPVMFLGFGLNNLFHSEVPLTLTVALFFIVLIYASARRFIAYYRWTGKYPYYFLFGKARGSRDGVNKGEEGSQPEKGGSA